MSGHYGLRFVLDTLRILGIIRIVSSSWIFGAGYVLRIRITYLRVRILGLGPYYVSVLCIYVSAFWGWVRITYPYYVLHIRILGLGPYTYPYYVLRIRPPRGLVYPPRGLVYR